MICPYCRTINRDDQDICYHCNRDLSMLRLIVNKAKHHYNIALEHAERGRYAQAITELQNALDLDRHNKDALVVMGTVYARMGQLDKAREYWTEALKLEPILYKAQDYLRRAESVKAVLPRLDLITTLALLLFISLIVNIALTFYFTTPRKEERSIQKAWNSYLGRDYSTALSILNDLETGAKKPIVKSASGILKENIKNYFNWQIQAIKQAEAENNLYDAMRLVRETLRRNPPLPVRDTLIILSADLRQVLIRHINKIIADYYNGEESFARTTAEIDKFMAAFFDDPEAKNMERRRKEIEEDYFNKLLEDLNALAESGEKETAIQEAQKLKEKFTAPQFSSKLTEFVDRTRMASLKELITAVRTAIENEDFMTSDKLLGRLQEKVIELTPELKSQFQELLINLKQEQTKKYLATLKRYYLSKNYTQVLALHELKELIQLTPAQEKMIEKLHDNSVYQLVLLTYNWLRSKDKDYRNFSLTEADARATIDTCSRVMEIINTTDSPKYADKIPFIMFCCGTAHLKLGDWVTAEQIFSDLKDNFPRSPYSRLAQELLVKASSPASATTLPGETQLREELTTTTLPISSAEPLTTAPVTAKPLIVTESTPAPPITSTIIVTSPTIAIIF